MHPGLVHFQVGAWNPAVASTGNTVIPFLPASMVTGPPRTGLLEIDKGGPGVACTSTIAEAKTFLSHVMQGSHLVQDHEERRTDQRSQLRL